MTNEELRKEVYKINAALVALQKAQYAMFQTEDYAKNTIINICHDEAAVIAWGLKRYIKEYETGEERKQMKLKIKLDDGAIMPTRAHATDAGLDLYSREDVTIYPIRRFIENYTCYRAQFDMNNNSYVFDTGVHIEIPAGYVGFLKSKSGLNVKASLLNEGVIDAGYTGSIKVKLYNFGKDLYTIKKGDKISQLVILPIITPDLEQVESLDDTERGENGFGSSGR